MNLQQLQTLLNKKVAEHSYASRTLEDEEEALGKAKTHLQACKEGLALVQEIAQGLQENAHRQIADIVSKCLETIFGEEAYEFKINFVQRRGRTEAELIFSRNGMEVDPASASGGGVVDVASFALRVAALMLSQPKKRKLLVLDEPWKHLSAKYRPAVAELVEALAEEMTIQFIIITHSPEFEMGKVITVGD